MTKKFFCWYATTLSKLMAIMSLQIHHVVELWENLTQLVYAAYYPLDEVKTSAVKLVRLASECGKALPSGSNVEVSPYIFTKMRITGAFFLWPHFIV